MDHVRLPPDPFGRLPERRGFDRADRVRLLREAADALVAGRMPSREAALFLGGAIGAYLRQGGSLDRDYLRVVGPRGSHATAARIAAALGQRRGGDAPD